MKATTHDGNNIMALSRNRMSIETGDMVATFKVSLIATLKVSLVIT